MVVQVDSLNQTLPTLVVVPLDVAAPIYQKDPTAVRVSAREAGSTAEHVAAPTRLRVVRSDDLALGVVGRLSAQTQTELDRVLKLVLGLR